MKKPMVGFHDIETDQYSEREMNDAEFQEYEAQQTKATAEQAEAEAKATAKAALLAKLGITADEAALLLS